MRKSSRGARSSSRTRSASATSTSDLKRGARRFGARTGDAALAVQRKLPTMSSYREMVEAGILMGYAVNMADFVGHSAGYVDRILRDANPADMAIEQPTRFELVINAKTASAIGLTFPTALLQRADDVIR
ncbi:MAG: ABC transporter substrate binding protein [Vicinamibacteria bacterium]